MKEPDIIAHRGLHGRYAENSPAAFAAAWRAGVRWCECDVHATADGVPVVIHDATLERTTNLTGPVAARTAAEIAGVVPKLRQVLAEMPADCHMLIEIKPAANVALLSAVIEETRGRQCVIQSFDAATVRWALERKVDAAYLIEKEEVLRQCVGQGWAAVNINASLLRSAALMDLRAAGASIGAWTVNARRDIEQVIRIGVDRLITDQPLLARRVCGWNA